MMEVEDYPTRCEIELVEKNKAALLTKMEGEFNLVDLGAALRTTGQYPPKTGGTSDDTL